MNIAEKIYQEACRLPEHLAEEVLDFIEFIQKKHDIRDKELENLKEAQLLVMNRIWDNEDDEVWNEDPAR